MIPESQRFALHERLGEVLGQPEADTLMDLLPPIDWDDIATRSQQELLRADVRLDVANARDDVAKLRADMIREITTLGLDLQGEMVSLQTTQVSLKAEMALLGSRLSGELVALQADLKVGQARNLMVQTGSNLVLVVAVVAVVLGLR
jgi:hypothetical protein